MAGDDTNGLALVDDHHRVGVAQHGSGGTQRLTRADQRQWWAHVLSDGIGKLCPAFEYR